MQNIAIIYWSGTGNTEAMAEAVAKGVKQAGAAAELIEASAVDASSLNDYSALAFGCPSRAKRSPSSAPTAGATAPGWRTGSPAARATAPCWWLTA